MLNRQDEINIIKNAKTAKLNVNNIMESKFKKIDGKTIDNVAEYIKSYFKMKKEINEGDEFEIFIGTDSQRVRHGKLTLYATVICLYTVGKGAHVIYTRVKRDDIFSNNKEIDKSKKTKKINDSLFNRLWWEVEYTIQVANYLKNEGVLIDNNVTQLHLDISANSENKSNIVYKSAIGYIESMGYNVRTKPFSPASSYAADMVVRGL